MLLIYVNKVTNRLGYTLNLIFRDIMHEDYSITTDKEAFAAHEGAKFSYCRQRICDEVFLYSTDLLFQTAIEVQTLDFFDKDGVPRFFRVYSADSVCDFDILAASFYLVSRYEEYLPFIQDEHLRFRYQDSLAYKKGFLGKPLVNIWVEQFRTKIRERYPQFATSERFFSFLNTIDVDSAYSYICKGLPRTVFGFAKDALRGRFSLCAKRIKVLTGFDADPYDTFDYIIAQQKKYRLNTIFFILFGYYGCYDKNISPDCRKFRLLIKSLCDYAKVGLHPSYETFDEPSQLTSQIKNLKSVIHKPLHRSRFHYLRFRLPESYRALLDNNIEADYSMGYANNVGFRASICTSFNFYDLALDFETKLRVFPFAYMDVALKNGLNLSPDKALEEIKSLADEVKKVNGQFISVWHNESLSDCLEWKGWREVYEGALAYASGESGKSVHI